MARVTPQEFAERHNRRTKAALQDMQTGVMNVTESPTIRAAKSKDKMRARILASIDNGKWEKGLRAVTKEEWQKKMVEVGIPRVSAGLDANIAKVQDFATKFLPHLDQGVAAIAKMPNVTLQDNINRAVAMINHNANFKR